MFCDEAIIKISGGSGGNGCVSFHREKFVAKGPPDGGDGGQGGSIIFKVSNNINTLTQFRRQKHFKAPVGENGRKNNMTGKNGEDIILKVPVGTMIINQDSSELITDLTNNNEIFIAAKGGKGGLGNARFVNSINQAPQIAERGEPGIEREIKIELKLVADIGIIGFPNAGKSTLISVISNARPKIANYPFTTIIPNLGVVSFKDQLMVFCDIPGIIEGAHQGKGLGAQFLKHVERTKVLIHLLDASSETIWDDFKHLNHELKNYSPKLAEKYQLIVLSKIDIIDKKQLNKLRKLASKNGIKKIIEISSVTNQGLDILLAESIKLLQSHQEEEPEIKKNSEIKIFRPHQDIRMSNFVLHWHKKKLVIEGQRIEQLVKMTDYSQSQSVDRLEKIFIKCGLHKAMEKKGIKPGQKFKIAGIEFIF